LFKDQHYADAAEAFRLAAFLSPGDAAARTQARRAGEAYRLSQIRRIETDAALDPAPGQEAAAYADIARLLDLGANDTAELRERLSRLRGRLPAADYDRLARAAYEPRSLAARALSDAGRIGDALKVCDTLAVLESTGTAPGVRELRAGSEERGAAVRATFASLSANRGAGSSEAALARAGLALKRAFPDDRAAVRRVDAALARYRADHPLTIKETFYLHKLYLLAALRYAQGADGDAAYGTSLLEEVLRRDPADADADALLGVMRARAERR
ncbi:MAG: hypothetical protein KGL53_09630, partial [Elusimicrobia bacterium]|nr:hypothetical protein [Elusimicrobiota bacterium]